MGLYEIADEVAGNFTMTQLKKSESHQDLKRTFDLAGTYEGNHSLLKDKKIWVFLYDQETYYPGTHNLIFTADHNWFIDDVLIGLRGKFKILFVVTDANATEFIYRWNELSNGWGFSELPRGSVVLNYFEYTENQLASLK